MGRVSLLSRSTSKMALSPPSTHGLNRNLGRGHHYPFGKVLNESRVPRRSNMFCLSYHCLLCLQIMRTIARVVRQREEGDGPPCSTPNGVGRPRLPVHRAFITLFRGPPPVMFYPPMVAVALNPLRRRRRRLKKVRLVVARGPANSTRRPYLQASGLPRQIKAACNSSSEYRMRRVPCSKTGVDLIPIGWEFLRVGAVVRTGPCLLLERPLTRPSPVRGCYFQCLVDNSEGRGLLSLPSFGFGLVWSDGRTRTR